MRRIVGLGLALFMVGALAGATPRYGGTLTIAMEYDPATLDPLVMTDTPAANVFMHVAEALFRLGPGGELEHILAKSFEASEDGLVWTFYLQEGVKFHDGTPFNAEAAKWNLLRFRDKATFGRTLGMNYITDIEVINDHTMRVHLSGPFAPLLVGLAHSFTGFLSPTAVAAGVGHPVGTGPFVFVRWIPGTELVLEKNPNYWGEGPYLDRLVFLPIPEGGTRVMKLLAGEVDVTTVVPPDDVPIVNADPKAEVVIIPSLTIQYVGMNCQRGPLANPLVRQALNYAVDKQEIVDFVFGGFASVAAAPFSPGVFGYHAPGPYVYDVEKAKDLLTKAGYPNGFKTTLRYNPGWRTLGAEVIQAQLKVVGIEVELISMEWGSYLDFTLRPADRSETDIYMLGWSTVTGDADYTLYSLFHGTQWAPAGSNRSFYKNETVDDLLTAARTTPAPELREQYYAQAIELIWDEAPWLFLLNPDHRYGARTNVRGLVFHPNFTIQAHLAWLDN